MKYKAIGENHLYVKAYTKGKRAATGTVVVYVLGDKQAYRFRKANPSKTSINRIGLTVTKKIGGAVTRSRVKRVLREAYRLTDKRYGVKTGHLIVLMAREGTVKAKTPQVEKDLAYALRKLGLIV